MLKKISTFKILVTFHSFRDEFKKNTYFFNKILKNVDLFIAVSENEKNKLLYYGCEENKIKIIPAYINPIKIDNDFNEFSLNVKEYINDDHNILICCNGCIRFYNSQDLYGIDLLIELMNKLILNHYKKIKMIIVILGVEEQNNKEKEYYFKLKNKIKTYRLEDKLLIYEAKNTEFYPILENSDLFIRPTNTDGDAISIRESIYFNVPVIASDIVERPKGTILFKNRNFEDLYTIVVDTLENYDYYKKEVEKVEVEDNSEKIIKVYEELLNN